VISRFCRTSRARATRLDERRVSNGNFWWPRTGASRVDILKRYGPRLTRVNRFKRWRTVALMPAIPADRFVEYPRALACRRPPRKDGRSRCLVRSRGGPVTEIRARVDSAGVPIALKLTEGQELYEV
jgi:transposase